MTTGHGNWPRPVSTGCAVANSAVEVGTPAVGGAGGREPAHMVPESCHQCRKDERAGNGRWLRMRREGEVPGATPQLPSIIGPPAPGCARAGQCAGETAKVVCTGSDLLK